MGRNGTPSTPPPTCGSFIEIRSSARRGGTPPPESNRVSNGGSSKSPPTGLAARLHAAPSIIVLLVCATVFSTVVSLSGGLIMYLESISSLEDTVRETSAAEVCGLVNGLRGVIRQSRSFTEETRGVLYGKTLAADSTKTAWSDRILELLFGFIKGSHGARYSAGVVLLPHNGTDGSVFYTSVWADPLLNGGREFLSGVYSNDYPQESYFPVEDGEIENMSIHTNWLDEETGEGRFAYLWDAKSYVTDFLYDWGPGDEGLPPAGIDGVNRWFKPERGASAAKWRPPRYWFSSDKTAYTYTGYDAVYAPPPPPHPWSGYKAVLIISQFLYATWDEVIRDYMKNPESTQTTVLVVDSVTQTVFTSTSHKHRHMVDAECLREASMNLTSPLHCATTVQDFSVRYQDAFHGVKKRLKEMPSSFFKLNLDGEEHFVRYTTGFHEDVLLIWIRPVSSVQGKVDEALRILIGFTCMIFFFDMFLSAVEIYYIALPVKHLSEAIISIGNMETNDASQKLQRYENQHFVMKEVKSLMEGMKTTIVRLSEYKAFIPDAALFNGYNETLASNGIEPPEGNVALVFTDIVRSTELWEAVPEAMAVSMDLHNRVVRQALIHCKGYEVKTIGDAFMVAFQSPLHAVSFCCMVQTNLLKEAWPEDICQFSQADAIYSKNEKQYNGLRVRMGVHYGPVQTETNPLTERADYRGFAVNKAARIESVALPGMVAVSSEIRNLLQGETNNDAIAKSLKMSYHTLGPRELKGIGTEEIHYVLPEALKLRAQLYDSFSVEGAATVRISLPNARAKKASETLGCSRLQLRRSPGAYVVVKMARVAELSMGSQCELGDLLGSLNATVGALVDASCKTAGKVEAIIGTTLTVSWNCASTCSAYAVQCVQFCGLVETRCAHVCLGAVCGTLLKGFAGTANKKYHTVLGASVRYAEILAETCRVQGKVALMVMHGGVKPQYAHCCVPVDVWEGQHGFEPLVVVEQLRAKECCDLRSAWHEPNTQSTTPCGTLRSLLSEALERDVTKDLADLSKSLTPGTDAVLQHSLTRLLGKAALITPASSTPLLFPTTVKASLRWRRGYRGPSAVEVHELDTAPDGEE